MIVIKQKGETIFLKPQDIIYALAQSNYTLFYTKDRKKIISSKCIKEYENLGLLRISRSLLINKEEVKSISGDYIDIGLKQYFKISRRMKKIALSILMACFIPFLCISQDTVRVGYCDLGFLQFWNDTLFHRNSLNGEWQKVYIGDLRSKGIVSDDISVSEYSNYFFLEINDSVVKPRHLDRVYLTNEVDGNPNNELQALKWDSLNHRIGLTNVPLEMNNGAYRLPSDPGTQYFDIPRYYSWFWDFVHDTKITSYLNAYNNGLVFQDTVANMIPGNLWFAQNTSFGPNIIKLEQGNGITYGYQTNPTTTYPYKTVRISANDISETNEINVLGGTYNSTTNILNITGTNGGGSVNFDLSELDDIGYVYDLESVPDSSVFRMTEDAVVKDIVKVIAKVENASFTIGGSSGGGGVTDHGALTGLLDDDHPQYHNDFRGDLRYAQLSHNHDDRYYTESEVDALIAGAGGGLTDGDYGEITVGGSGTTMTVDNGLAATKIGSGTVDNTEFGYLNGVTSAIQTQISGKANTSHTHALSELTQSGATTGQYAQWNGSAWVPATVSGGGSVTIEEGTGSGTITTSNTTIVDLSLASGTWKVDVSGWCAVGVGNTTTIELFNVGSSTVLTTSKSYGASTEEINFSMTRKITLASTTTIRVRGRTDNSTCAASDFVITAIK